MKTLNNLRLIPINFMYSCCLICFVITGGYSQRVSEDVKLDTLFANEQMQVALFFPFSIKQAVTGTPRMSFTYNKEYPQKLGLLKAQPGEPSNLLVIDQKDNVYSFILKYRKELPELNYTFTRENAIIKLSDESKSKTDSISLKEIKKAEDSTYSKSFAQYLLKRSLPVFRKKGKQKMWIILHEIQIYQDRAYLSLELLNKSAISFIPGKISVFLESRDQGKRHSGQQQKLDILGIQNFPAKLGTGEKKKLVIVLPKFSVPKNWKLKILIQEENGRRYSSI